MTLEEHIKSQPDGRKIWQRYWCLFQITEMIHEAIAEEGIGLSELSERTGFSVEDINRILEGDENMTVGEVSDIFFELRCDFYADISYRK